MRAPLLAAALCATSLLLAGPAGAGEPPSPCLNPPVVAPVADPFRPPGCRWCPGNRGIEYATAAGTAARAGAAGTVSFAGTVAGTRYVVVEHPSGLRTTYGRLATIAVTAGRAVSAGTVVGTTTARLFFGVRRGDAYLDPAHYLVQQYRRPRLVPTDGGSRRPDRSARFTCRARLTTR